MRWTRCFNEIHRLGLRFLREDAGASLLEYALMVCIISIAVVVTLGNVGAAVQSGIWTLLQKAYAAYMTGG